jgi:hypothetical protein
VPLVFVPSTTPEPPVIVPPKVTPAPPPFDKEYFTWTPNGGPTVILSEASSVGAFLGGIDDSERSVIGLDMPPQEEFDTQLPGGGELANGRRWLARPFALPMVIAADTLDGAGGLEQHRRALMSSFNPERGEGVFMVAYPGGERRYLNASYSSGLEAAEWGRRGYPYRDGFTVMLKARDPFPYGDEKKVTFRPPENYEFFAPPGDTTNVFYISSSNTTGDETVVIDGEVDVWPEWRIKGPVSQVTLRNRDTGKVVVLNAGIDALGNLTVRTDPRTPMAQKVVRNSQNGWAQVVGTANFPVLWSLRPGSNRVTVLATGTVPGQSSIELRYRPRYLNA